MIFLLRAPAHDAISEEITTKVDIKEVPDATPKAGDGKSEKLLASAEFPDDGTGNNLKESSVGD